MILLVTPALSAPDCATRLQEATAEQVIIASGFSDALVHLRASELSIVILDRNLLEAEPHQTSTLWAHLESTIIVELNLVLTGIDRLIREVQSARKRSEHNQAVARDHASRLLQGEVNQTLTSLLLNCELAAQITGLPSSACERIAFIHGDAEKLRQQLAASCTN